MFEVNPLGFVDGQIIGNNVKTEDYLRQDPEHPRGHPEFVISRSELMLFMSNPSRWIRGYTFKDTDATEWGSLIDCLLTSPDTFKKRFALTPETCTATKTMKIVKEGNAQAGDPVPWSPTAAECKDWKEDQISRGLQVVSRDDWKCANDAIATLGKDAWIDSMLREASYQVMAIATYVDKDTGIKVPLKCLIDIVPSMKGQFANGLTDFKTARTAAPSDWDKACRKQHYDVQAVMSLDIWEACKPKERWVWYHVIQENEFPWQPARRYMTDTMMAMGRIDMWQALKRYCQCLKESTWPSWDDAGPGVVNGFGPITANPYEAERSCLAQ
jgi:hypothetical protein